MVATGHIRRLALLLMGMVGAIAALAVVLQVTGKLALEEVILDGNRISSEEAINLGLRPGKSVLTQNCELVAQIMCRRAGVGSAVVEIDLPNRVVINTNNTTIKYVALDERTNKILGVDGELRIAPFDGDHADPDAPAFIGLGELALYETPGDYRLPSVVEALETLRSSSEEWLAKISSIDFSSHEFVTVSFDDIAFPAVCHPATLALALEEFFRLEMNGYWPVEDIELIDLRYDRVVIVRGARHSVESIN